METAIGGTIAKFGGIDVLINNAGFALLGPLEGASLDDLRREIDTNIMGVIGMIQLVLPLMREGGSGVIVNVSSLGGRMTLPLFSTYHATKFAVEGLTEALQYELQEHGIRVKLIEPGGSKTNFDSSSMVRTPHPAYQALIDGFDKMWKKESAKLPGPEKVVQAIYRAATDGSACLRYPVLAFPFLNIRNLIGAIGWSAIMKMMVRRMR
jgi:NAD(P)-dependent dehydrogenase (short-subunit alcohol dehydrogenase family)